MPKQSLISFLPRDSTLESPVKAPKLVNLISLLHTFRDSWDLFKLFKVLLSEALIGLLLCAFLACRQLVVPVIVIFNLTDVRGTKQFSANLDLLLVWERIVTRWLTWILGVSRSTCGTLLTRDHVLSLEKAFLMTKKSLNLLLVRTHVVNDAPSIWIWAIKTWKSVWDCNL